MIVMTGEIGYLIFLPLLPESITLLFTFFNLIPNIYVPLFIFFARILDVSLGTLRIMFVYPRD